jgi:hypothetical protein
MTEETRHPRTDDLVSGSGTVERDEPSAEKRDEPSGETEPRGGQAPSGLEPLLPPEQEEDFRGQWDVIQTAFVDEPRRAVEQADSLVANLMKRLAETFSERRDRLEQQWDRGDEVSTEELRVALQRYRSFFDRLLKA